MKLRETVKLLLGGTRRAHVAAALLLGGGP